MKLQAEKSQLLVIDVQERLAPVMHDMDAMTHQCGTLIEAACHLDIPMMISEQYRKGLGATLAPLREKAQNAPLMEKMHFSCFDDPNMRNYLEEKAKSGHEQFVLTGIEAHICVAQTALDLAAAGHQTYVVADAVTSRKPRSVEIALERLRDEGVKIITTEMALFEWLHQSGTDMFKKISKLVK